MNWSVCTQIFASFKEGWPYECGTHTPIDQRWQGTRRRNEGYFLNVFLYVFFNFSSYFIFLNMKLANYNAPPLPLIWWGWFLVTFVAINNCYHLTAASITPPYNPQLVGLFLNNHNGHLIWWVVHIIHLSYLTNPFNYSYEYYIKVAIPLISGLATKINGFFFFFFFSISAFFFLHILTKLNAAQNFKPT